MEKSPLPTTSSGSIHPGLPDGLVVGMANGERRLRLRRGLQCLFLLLSCLTVAHIGMNTIAYNFGHRDHHSPHHYHHHFQAAEGVHKGPPKPLACYPLAPAETVNVTFNLRPGRPAGPPDGPGPHHDDEKDGKASLWSLLSSISKTPSGPPPPPPGPPHIYLHPSLFSSNVSLLREGDADKGHLGHAPGGPEGIIVFATFSREAISGILEEGAVKRVDICTHRAPDGALVGAFFPPPDQSAVHEEEAHVALQGESEEKSGQEPHRPHHQSHRFPPHPKDQFPDISAKIYLPSGLGIHLDSIPPPPPHHKKKHGKSHHEDVGHSKKRYDQHS